MRIASLWTQGYADNLVIYIIDVPCDRQRAHAKGPQYYSALVYRERTNS